MVDRPDPSLSAAGDPWLEISTSRLFTKWLIEQRISLGFTTYHTGKLFLLARHPQREDQATVIQRNFPRSMGLWTDGQTMWLSTLYQILRFENLLRPGEIYQGCDRVYVPRTSHVTGDVDTHDIAVDGTGRVIFAAAKFSCLATLHERYSFTPLWRPPFISKLAPEDRCHLNGLAMENGRPRYVTLVGASDVADGWRDRRFDGGCVLEVPSGRVIAQGLSMPHSPRIHQGKLWVLNSGTGMLGSIDLASGSFVPLAFCPGYLRGLALIGDYAVVGLSRHRHDMNFGGLALDQELAKRNADARCALHVIDLRTGDTVHWVRLEGVVTELYDVVVLPGVSQPNLLGFRHDEIQSTIVVGDEGKL